MFIRKLPVISYMSSGSPYSSYSLGTKFNSIGGGDEGGKKGTFLMPDVISESIFSFFLLKIKGKI